MASKDGISFAMQELKLIISKWPGMNVDTYLRAPVIFQIHILWLPGNTATMVNCKKMYQLPCSRPAARIPMA